MISEECGVFGVFSKDEEVDVARLTYYGLFALQHRGQESCGIAVNHKDKNGKITVLQHKDLGLVPEVLSKFVENSHKGYSAIGHVRYSTFGSNCRQNAQPIISKYKKGTFCLAHNGNITNATEVRGDLENEGFMFQTETDSEIITALIAKERVRRESTADAVLKVMKTIKGAYSIVMSTPNTVMAMRDPNGFRPLSIAKIKNSYVFGSETSSFDATKAEFIRDVRPGEVVICDKNGLKSVTDLCGKKTSFCIFEYVYFSRPDSILNGVSVHEFRIESGKMLAKQSPCEADLVVGVPDSGFDAAIGYSRESKIEFGFGIVKNKYVGRTFIQPTQLEREATLKIKLNIIKNEIKNKRIVIIDDSIVRGTTSKQIIKMLREAGAKEIHVRISSPPFLHPCYFGTDVPSRDKLITCQKTTEEICKFINADSLFYITAENLKIALKHTGCVFCDACFSGKYPDTLI